MAFYGDGKHNENMEYTSVAKIKEIIDELNNLKIIQKTIDFLEDLPEDIYKKWFENRDVDSDLNVNKHRWYETSISVFEIPQGFIGVKSVTDTFSEQSMVEDMFHTLEFFEMEPIITTTYKIKKS